MEQLSHNHADDTSELLSAFIDNAVDVAERRRAEQLIERCAACAQEVRDLRLFKTLLQELPAVQPRRSFTLDPATAPRPRWLLFPTLRLAMLVATALLFVVVGFDALRPGVSAPSAATTSQAPAAGSAPMDLRINGSSEAAVAGAEEAAEAAPAAQDAAAASAAALSAPVAPPSSPVAEAYGGAAPPPSAVPEPAASAAAGARPPSEATSDQATGAASAAPSNEPDMGQMGDAPLTANEPSSPDTMRLAREDAQDGSTLSTLRIIEIALALIALGFGGAAVWAWRQQR